MVNELYHHGVKGMQWGVRRYQNSDGTYTDAGHRHYGFGYAESSRRSSIGLKRSNRNVSRLPSRRISRATPKRANVGATANDAATIAKRKKVMKTVGTTLLVAGGIAAAAVVAQHCYKRGIQASDSVLKKGSYIQRIEGGHSNFDIPKMFYGSTRKADNALYRGQFGDLKIKRAGNAFIKDIRANKDINIAGNKSGEKAFKNLYDSDSEFRNFAKDMAKENQLWKPGRKLNKVRSDHDTKRMYENFNINMVKDEYRDTPEVKKYFDSLKAKGYGGLKDVNDQRFSSFKSTDPVIYFDNVGNMEVEKIRDLPRRQITIDYGKTKSLQLFEGSLEKASVGSLAAGSAGYIYSTSGKDKKTTQYRPKR